MSRALSLDLNRVAVFLRVVDEGGFTAAARTLSLPKSSVSRSVSLLEEEIKTRLLHRTSRKVTPTDAGHAFYERASRGMSLFSEAREAAVDLGTELRGPIRITTAVDLAMWKLAPMVQSFVAEHPAVTVDVTLTTRVVSLLEEGFDFALRAGTLRDESLIARKLPATEFALYASPGYLAQCGRPRRVRDLAHHRCVLFRAPSGRAVWSLHSSKGSESVEVRGQINADDFSFCTQVLVAGAGIGLLPSFVAESAGMRLERVLARYAAPGAPLHLVYPAERYMPQRSIAFRDHVIEQVAKLAPRSRPRPCD